MPQPTALKPPSTARTAGRSGGCGGACDASPLSCFLFRPRKNRKSAGNAVIPTFPTHRSHGLQHLRHKRPTFAFMRESGYTLAFAQKIAHSGLHTETGAFRTGPLSLPSERSARSQTSPGRVSERRTLPLWDLGREVLPKNAESLRSSDALMRVAVPRRRGPAGLRNLFLLLSELWLVHPALSAFRMCETRGGITTLSALCVLLKRRTAACQNGSFAVL